MAGSALGIPPFWWSVLRRAVAVIAVVVLTPIFVDILVFGTDYAQYFGSGRGAAWPILVYIYVVGTFLWDRLMDRLLEHPE